MKYSFLIALYHLLILNSLSQNGKPILVGMYQTTVPKGKVWKLEKGKAILVEFDYFDKYSMCGAAIQSYPGLILIRSGDTPPFKVNEVYFTQLKKTAFANGLTYSITPTEDLYFYPGTSLMVGTCLKNIQFMEYDLTEAKLDRMNTFELNKKIEEEKIKEENRIEEEETAKRLKEKEDAMHKEFLLERSRKTYQLKEINKENYQKIYSDISWKLSRKYSIDKEYLSFKCKYNLKFKSDTLGNQEIILEKISGDNLDQDIINDLKTINIDSPKLNKFYVSSEALYPITIEFTTSDLKVRKYHSGIIYLKKVKPSEEVKNEVGRKLSQKNDGTYELKYSESNVLDEKTVQLKKIHKKDRWFLKTMLLLFGITTLIVLK